MLPVWDIAISWVLQKGHDGLFLTRIITAHHSSHEEHLLEHVFLRRFTIGDTTVKQWNTAIALLSPLLSNFTHLAETINIHLRDQSTWCFRKKPNKKIVLTDLDPSTTHTDWWVKTGGGTVYSVGRGLVDPSLSLSLSLPLLSIKHFHILWSISDSVAWPRQCRRENLIEKCWR